MSFKSLALLAAGIKDDDDVLLSALVVVVVLLTVNVVVPLIIVAAAAGMIAATVDDDDDERTAARLSRRLPDEPPLSSSEISSAAPNKDAAADADVVDGVTPRVDKEEDPNEKAENVVEVVGLSCLKAEKAFDDDVAAGFLEKEKTGLL